MGPQPPRHAAHDRQLRPAAPSQARTRPAAPTPRRDRARCRVPVRRVSARRNSAAPAMGLRLGVIPRGVDNDALERELVAALSDALTQPVGVHRAADYRVVLSGLEQGLVDFAWLPPLVAARA